MKSLTLLVGTLLLAGCANLPNIPSGMGIPGLPGLPGASSGVSVDQVTQAVKSVQTATKEFTEAEEIEIGQGVAQSMLGAAPLVKNARVQRYVNQVGRWLALQTNRPNLPWNFGVLDNENINAFAAPGGSIFITSGLMRRLQSEAELAGVLAHEIAHVIQKHHINALKSGAWGDVGKLFGQAVLDNKLGKTGGGQLARAAGLGELGAEWIKQGIFVKPLDRSLEYEADRMGVIIAARAGYDPYGLVSALQMLQARAVDSASLALLFKTHPAPADRIAELEKLANLLDRYQAQDQGRERFAAATGISQAAPGAGSKPAASPAKPAAKPAAAPAKKPGG